MNELLERIQCIHAMLDELLYEPERDVIERDLIIESQAPLVLLGRLLKGAEPAPRADLRAAMARIEACRNRRPDHSSSPSE